jgi:hypothetical protein
MSAITDSFNFLVQGFNRLLQWLLAFLPDSPFRELIDTLGGFDFSEYLGYLNYFVPFDFFFKALSLWLTAVMSYLVYTVVKDKVDKLLNL